MNDKFHHNWFRKQPVGVQDQILDELYKAMLWRGWDRCNLMGDPGQHAREHVCNIVDILLANGCEMEEYT